MVHVFAGTLIAMLLFEIIAYLTKLNTEMVMPLEVMADVWVGLLSIYIGVDRAMFVVKSATLNYGEVDVGEPGKIREMILISAIILIVAIIGTYVTNLDFQLDQFAMAFGASIALYVAGQKGIQTAKWSNGQKDEDENGIPDDEQEDYERWARKQRKDGVESKFINYNYYKDELFYEEEASKDGN